MTVDPDAVRDHVASVRERIRAAGGADVDIVAVTKGFGPDAVRAALGAGLTMIGESYAQECLAKWATVESERAADDPRASLHFIGGLQRNKVRKLAPVVDVWQSVDRPELGREIARRAPGATVMVQVDISGEATKRGCDPAVVPAFVEELTGEGLQVVGLMGIAPLGPPTMAAPGFRRLRGLVDRLGLETCSMGMTDDLEVAVAEGTTMVRIGRALFGPRPS